MTRTTEAGFDLTRRPQPLASLLRDVWRSRELIAILARQNFFVQYRRASFGALWAVAIPVVQAAVLSFVLGRVVRFPGVDPYFIFLLASTTAWNFFGLTMGAASVSIVSGAGLSTKIYFPRLIFPIVGVAAGTYSLVLSVAVLLVAAPLYGVSLSLNLLWLFPAVGLLIALTTGFVSVLSALHVYFRDTRYIVQAALLAWFYATPGFYPLDAAVGSARTIIEMNPMTGVIELFHRATVGASADWARPVAWSIGWTVGLAALALLLHRRFDRVFGDLL